ncbi:hypothetical protein [Sphingobacterium endophyticum]|uniref:hypothetical protein n=1 Tax=Sphingobacterium endophyticum TaxID=2546448 RepID=UPI0012E0F16C|nr:hypothetical protein [Sphingobacterium endophyticum]
MRNRYIFNRLEPLLEEIFDVYDISHTTADASVHVEEGWPIGTDVYIICGFLNTELYIQRMYIVKEAIDLVINRQIVKMIEKIKIDISERNNIRVTKKS